MERAISPSDFRLFFNRFVRRAQVGYEIRIPNIPEFVQECDRISLLITDKLTQKDLTPLSRCRLLDDLGALSLIASVGANEGSYEHAKKMQHRFLKSGFFNSSSAWDLAEKEHALVHHCATFWRGTGWDAPTPVELASQADIVRYLFSIASKTPSIVDIKRYVAVEHFVHQPQMVNDHTTTRSLVELFDKNWFHPNSQIQVIELQDLPSIKVVYNGPIKYQSSDDYNNTLS